MDYKVQDVLKEGETIDDLIKQMIKETIDEEDPSQDVIDMLKNIAHNYIATLVSEANQIAELQGS